MAATNGDHRLDTLRIELPPGRSLPGPIPAVAAPLPGPAPAPGPGAAADTRDLFSELLESLYDAVLITGFDGLVTRMNERAADLLLYSAQEVTAVNILNVLSGSNEGTLAWICRNLQNERRVFIECYCNRKNGTRFPADVTVNSLHYRDDGGELCFFIRNVSARKQTEEALKRAQEDLLSVAHKAGMADIATGVLHDVGNLVNSINVSSEMIASLAKTSTADALVKLNGLLQRQLLGAPGATESGPSPGRLLEAYSLVVQTLGEERSKVLAETADLQHKLSLLREVITTQQEYAKMGLFFQKVRLVDVIDDVLSLQQTHFMNHNVRVEKTCDDSLVVNTQKTKLLYILLNLIRNAVDALKELRDPNAERYLRVTCSAAADAVHLTVADTGIGIAPENLTRIFAHGFTTKASGHGFGLHTCANFMKEVGGAIAVQSAGLGKGSTFRLTFPRTRPEADLPKSEGA